MSAAAERSRPNAADQVELPAQGSMWTKDGWRGRWKVTAIGRKYITLTCTIPGLQPLRVDVGQWPDSWSPA